MGSQHEEPFAAIALEHTQIFQEPPEGIDETWRHGAVFNGIARFGDKLELAEAYKEAGDTLLATALGSDDVYFQLPPVLFNYRHALELYLKAVTGTDEQTHDLRKLFKVFSAYVDENVWTYEKDTDRWTRTDGLQRSQPSEILFIERCVQLLKPGTGRAAIVLPDGILGSPGLGYVREWIIQNCRILASIDLHPDTFQPFVSIQTSLLVLQRNRCR